MRAFDQLAAEYGGSAGNPSRCATCYLTTDMLGSTRMVTDQAGDVIARHDYLPFGQELLPPSPAVIGSRSSAVCGVNMSCYGVSDMVNQQFTGMEHDFDTGMDYFYARYYNRAEGRFTSADIPLLDQYPSDPQSWNLYGYVRNNPLTYVDPDGHIIGCPNGDCNPAPAPDPFPDLRTVFCLIFGCNGRSGGSGGGQPVGQPPTKDPKPDFGHPVRRSFPKTFACNSSAAGVMNALENDFASFANNPAQGNFSTFSIFTPGAASPGRVLGINVGVQAFRTIGYKDVSITVQSATSSQLVFQSNPGHVLYPARVSFSASNAGNGSITFTTGVDATTNGLWGTVQFDLLGGRAGETSTWNNLLDNVASFCAKPSHP